MIFTPLSKSLRFRLHIPRSRKHGRSNSEERSDDQRRQSQVNVLKRSKTWKRNWQKIGVATEQVLVCSFLLLVFSSCIDPVAPEFRFRDGFLLVDGEVTNEPGKSYVTISLTELVVGRYELTPYTASSVEVVADNGEVTPFFQIEETKLYRPAEGFVGQPGQTYFVRIITDAGQVIESVPETITEAVPIENLRMVFNQETYFNNDLRRFVPSFRFLVDFQDPAEEENYYRFRYVSWEQEDVCLSCFRGQVNRTTMTCQETEASRFVQRYDYICAEPCWEEEISERVNVFSDEFTNGNRVTNYEAARIDWDWQGFLLVIIEQQRISAANYEYNRVVSELSEGSGGLNATLPAALDGNIDSVTEGGLPVLGYFGAVATSIDRIFFDRDTVQGVPLPFDAALNLDIPPPPAAPYVHPCEGLNRSTIQPEGWGG